MRVLARLYNGLHDHPQRVGKLLGVGVSVMGAIDNVRGLVCQSAEYPAWRDFGFREACPSMLTMKSISRTTALRLAWASTGSAMAGDLEAISMSLSATAWVARC